MNNTRRRTQTIPTTSPLMAAVVLALGIAQAAAILAYGLLQDPPSFTGYGFLAMVPTFAVLLMTTSTYRSTPTWSHAMVPLAAGVVVVTLLVGTYAVDHATWWVIGSVLSAVPLIALYRVCAR